MRPELRQGLEALLSAANKARDEQAARIRVVRSRPDRALTPADYSYIQARQRTLATIDEESSRLAQQAYVDHLGDPTERAFQLGPYAIQITEAVVITGPYTRQDGPGVWTFYTQPEPVLLLRALILRGSEVLRLPRDAHLVPAPRAFTTIGEEDNPHHDPADPASSARRGVDGIDLRKSLRELLETFPEVEQGDA